MLINIFLFFTVPNTWVLKAFTKPFDIFLCVWANMLLKVYYCLIDLVSVDVLELVRQIFYLTLDDQNKQKRRQKQYENVKEHYA